MNRADDPVLNVASHLVRYLKSNPEASDGLSGIRDFWLGGYPLPKDSRVLQAAVEQLMEAGVLVRIDLPGGEAIYRLSRPV